MIYGLAKKLTLLRQQHKLSQSEVARRLNISSSAVSAFEAEQISPSLETLVKLANLYHVSTDYLLGVDYPRDKAVLDTSGLNKQQLTVLQNLIDVMKLYGTPHEQGVTIILFSTYQAFYVILPYHQPATLPDMF